MQSRLIFIIFLTITVNAQSEVELLNKSDLEKLISKREGKILVLNIWATWCIPCREEIPDLIELQRKYSKDIDVVGISVDFPDEVEKRILPFIKQQNIRYKMFVNNMKDEDLINFFNVKWNGAVPASFIYEKTGKLTLFMEGKKSLKDFEGIIKELIM